MSIPPQEVNSEEHRLLYNGRKLNPSQQGYASVDKEGLAIDRALERL